MKLVASLALVLLCMCNMRAVETPTDTVWSIGPDRLEDFGSPKDIEFAEDQQYLIAGTDFGNIVMLNIADGSTKSVVQFNPGAKSQNVYLEVLPQIHCVAVVATLTFRLYSYPSWALIKEFTLPGNFPAHALRVTPDGKTVVFVNEDWRMFAVDVASTDTLWRVLAGGIDATLAMSGDGRLVATANGIRDVELFEVVSGASLGKVRALGDLVKDVDLSSDGTRLLVTSFGSTSFPDNGPGALTVWNTVQKSVEWEIKSPVVDNLGYGRALFTPRGSGVYVYQSTPTFRGECLYKIGDTTPVRKYQPSGSSISRASSDSALGLGFSDARIWLNRVSWTPTSDVEPPAQSTISVYPNPTADGWTIVGLTTFENIGWTLADLSGRVLRQSESVVVQGRVVIDAPGLPSGAYMIRLSNRTQQIYSSTVQVQ